MQSKIFFLKKIGGRYLENLNSTFIISLVNFFLPLMHSLLGLVPWSFVFLTKYTQTQEGISKIMPRMHNFNMESGSAWK